MRSKLQCSCGATCWVRSDYEPDTNATNLDDSREREWEGGIEGHDHDNNFSIVDSEDEDDDWDYGFDYGSEYDEESST